MTCLVIEDGIISDDTVGKESWGAEENISGSSLVRELCYFCRRQQMIVYWTARLQKGVSATLEGFSAALDTGVSTSI